MIYSGDNILLLQKLDEESIDTIYIDPPYNTHLKTLTYSDTFEDWKGFMEERLILAHKALKKSGVIFLSIDEYSFGDLKSVMDKVFKKENYVETFIWVKNSTKNNSKTTSCVHEYILCYAKNKKIVEALNLFRIKKPGFDEAMDIFNKHEIEEVEEKLKIFYKENKHLKGISGYKKVDVDGIYQPDNMTAPGGNGLKYDIVHPNGKPVKIPPNGWRYSVETIEKHLREGLIAFGKTEKTIPRFKRYLHTVEQEVVKSVIFNYDDGEKDLQKIFGKKVFTNAKPVSLIKFLLGLTTPKDGTVLDFFAGSGTTGHSVIEMNLEDKGSRTFILCTNNENGICERITIPRVNYVLMKANLEQVPVEVLQEV
jgi:adenine-specific DNA-methyltransferase